MAEETVVREPLTQEMMSAGRELVRRLDEEDFEVNSALWLFSPEANQWLFIVATPEVDREGPKKVYSRLQTVLTSGDPVPGLSLHSINLLSPSDELVKLLKVALRTGKEITGIRFTRNRINNFFIEDAYIYRVA